MTYQPPPTPPVGQVPAAYAPPPKRIPVWPFVLGGGILILVVLGVIAAFAIPAYQNAQAAAQLARDEQAVEDVIVAFDEAYEDADCDDYEAVTDEDFRDDWSQENMDADYDCDEWEEGAETLTEDGEYTYKVDIDEVTVRGDRATVVTFEGTDDEVEYEYELERTDDGEWIVVSYEKA